jgi:hypothetical protein
MPAPQADWFRAPSWPTPAQFIKLSHDERFSHVSSLLLDRGVVDSASRDGFVAAALAAASAHDPRRYPPGTRQSRYEQALVGAWEYGLDQGFFESVAGEPGFFRLTSIGRELAAEPRSRRRLTRRAAQRAGSVLVALALGGVTVIFNGEVKDAWGRVTGKDRAHLDLLAVTVDGEPACNRHNNSSALGRIVKMSQFPRATFVLKNDSAKNATLTRVELGVDDVWDLHDPHGPVRARGEAIEVAMPAFGAYGGQDVRIDPEGFVVPQSIALARDIQAGDSERVKIVFRRIDDPTSIPTESVFLVTFRFVYEDGHVDGRLLFSSEPIGAYWPVYERDVIVDGDSTFDRVVDSDSEEALREIAETRAWAGMRVQRLVAERGIEWSHALPTTDLC